MTLVPEVTLRDAQADDALCIGVLGTQVYLDTYATHGIRSAIAREVQADFGTAAVAASLARPDTRFVLAECAGHLLGFVQLTLGARHALVTGKRTAEVDRLYVQSRFAGQGLGSRLLHHAEGLALDDGASHLWLTAWVGNRRASAYYARQGYRDVGSTDHVFEAERFENRVFVRELCGSTALRA